jgi:hypothetical protein
MPVYPGALRIADNTGSIGKHDAFTGGVKPGSASSVPTLGLRESSPIFEIS